MHEPAAATAQRVSPAATRYTIACYLRISHDDDDRDESNSITNQREMIHAYIAAQGEFTDVCVTDYIDDGKSGENTNRNGYTLLMSDVERGIVDCIIVKDLSRIGRNLLDVDDLLMNHLVTLGIRFIAINNGYDSFKHPLSNLELAIISLANQHYNRDLAQKSMTAKLTKQRRGEYLTLPPFGYKKSMAAKNKLVVDDEAAGYVRLIFSLACESRHTIEIAQILNAQGVPSPSVYKQRNGYKNIWSANAIDPDYCFWTISTLRRLLMNEVYIGKAVSNRHKVAEPGTGRTVPRPKDEWIVVPDMHEPLVSEPDFKKAQLILQRTRCGDAPGHIFANKIRCPSCGHAMPYCSPSNPRFKCATAKLTNHYGCRTHSILQSEITRIVLSSVKSLAATLVERDEIELAILQQSEREKEELGDRIKLESNAVRLLEESITRNFTLLVAEKITTEAFVSKKAVISNAIAQKNTELATLRERLDAIARGEEAAEERLALLRPLLTIEAVDKELVDLLIEKIYVHGEQEIEIVWAGKFS